jgi:DNA-binding transcriptional MerR regulator
MRIGELSRRTGATVPTLKFYLREGLLPRGAATGPTQAEYDEKHVRRVRLIRALVTVGGQSIAATRDLLTGIDSGGDDLHKVLGRTQDLITAGTERADQERWEAAERRLTELVGRRGWQIGRDTQPWNAAVEVVATMLAVSNTPMLDHFDDYAEAIERIAALDLAHTAEQESPDGVVAAAVLGTVLGEALLVALRRLAHEDASARRYASTERRR